MENVQFHLIVSDYSTITFAARMDGVSADGRIAICLEQNDLIKAVHKGMRCRISNEGHSIEGVVNSHNGLSVTCRTKERSLP